MFKRLFTSILAAVMLLGACNAAIATENTAPEKINIYEEWGDFEDEKYWESLTYKFYSEGALKKEIVEDGANGTGHSIYLQQTAGTWKDLKIFAKLVSGESYDVSLYMKTDLPEITSVAFMTAYLEGGYYMTGAADIGPEWSKYTYSVTIPEGKTSNRLEFRFNNGQTSYNVFVDEICVTPKGDVPDVDYSRINVTGITEDDGVSVTPPAEYCDVSFGDIDGHWAEDTITTLAKYGYVSGVEINEFAPQSNVTRAQFIKMIADLYDGENVAYNNCFSDVTAEQWFADVLQKANNLGIIPEEMVSDKNLKPDLPITREEAAAIAAKAAKDKGADKKKKVSFTDASDISDWAKASVEDAVAYGIINGYDDGSFLPAANITRAEAAAILKRVAETESPFDIYVDADTGNDKNDGTEDAPLATIYAARDLAKEFAPKMRNDITIRIKGVHYLPETFKLDETNSGRNGYRIIYTSWGEEKATLTMAKKYTGFQLHNKDKNIWKLYLGKGMTARQVYFNDVRGIRARTVGYLKNPDYILDSHYLCDNEELLYLRYPTEVEGIFNFHWMQELYKVEKISREDDRVRIDFNEYYMQNHVYVNNYGGTGNMIYSTPSYLENAYEFLDQCGEWYINKHDGYLYYIPRPGEDMQTMECKVPIGNQLMNVSGSSYTKPVSHLTFDNLIMEGTDWKRIDEVGGFMSVQNNVTLDSLLRGVQDEGAVHFDAARYIDFTNCDIRHTGQGCAALMFYRGCRNLNIEGNEISQNAGVGLMIDAQSENFDKGGYSPYEFDPKEYTMHVYVANNYIHSNSWVYHGGAQLGIGHPRHTVIAHNEIANAPYSGIHIGWGWTGLASTGSIIYDVEISHNYIHDVMMGRVYDGGAIYTLGASSLECDQTEDGTENKNEIIGNYIANGWKCDYIYHDSGTTSWYAADNVATRGPVVEHEHNFVHDSKFIEDFYWSHAYHWSNYWITHRNNYATDDYAYKAKLMGASESTFDPVKFLDDPLDIGSWPDEAQKIVADAGIEEKYRENFDLTGPKIFESTNRRQSIPLNTPTDSGMLVLGDYNTEYDLSDFEVYWWCEDPEAVTVDKDGMMTAHKVGIYEVAAMALVDGMWQYQHFMIDCGDEVEEIFIDQKQLNLIGGYKASVRASATTTLGHTSDITRDAEIEFKSDDTSVATVDYSEDGTVIDVVAVGEGKTSISIKVSYKGKDAEFTIPVNTITYGSDEGAKLPYKEIDFSKGWKTAGVKQPDGGMLIYGSPNHYMERKIDGLVAFDMAVVPGSGWPSIAFSDNDPKRSYSENDCYMIGFKEAYIEFQRWNKGARTMIFGEANNPISGEGVPNDGIYKHNERISVVIGAIGTDEGTRIILNINGENIIDYMDNSEGAIPSEGYYVIYNPAPGGMIFYPYSGITK